MPYLSFIFFTQRFKNATLTWFYADKMSKPGDLVIIWLEKLFKS